MLSVPLLKQKTGYTCGPTCIAMLAKFYGVKISWKTIMRASKCNKDGVSNRRFAAALQTLGFLVRARNRCNWQDLRRNYGRGFPVVVEWMYGYVGHFSIVVAVGKRHIVLADPDTGRRGRLSKDVFMRLWFDFNTDFFSVKRRNVHLR